MQRKAYNRELPYNEDAERVVQILDIVLAGGADGLHTDILQISLGVRGVGADGDKYLVDVLGIPQSVDDPLDRIHPSDLDHGFLHTAESHAGTFSTGHHESFHLTTWSLS